MTKIKFFFISAITCLFICSSCSRQSHLGVNAYLDYFNSPDSPFFKEKEFNKVIYKLKMQPAEYLVLKDNKTIDAKKFAEEVKKNSGNLSFVLIIEDNPQSKAVKQVVYKSELFDKLINYSNMQMNQDIKLVSKADTIPCSLVYIEPANSIQPVIRVAISFENVAREKTSEYTLVFNDYLFNNGILKFNYPSGTFADLPQLQF